MFTEFQLQVLKLIRTGYTKKEVTDKFGITIDEFKVKWLEEEVKNDRNDSFFNFN